jgi:hypothetical protein
METTLLYLVAWEVIIYSIYIDNNRGQVLATPIDASFSNIKT